MQEQNLSKKTTTSQRKSTDNNKKQFQSIANMADFLNKCCAEKEKLDRQAVIYAIQYGIIIIGEIADQVKKSFQNTIPKKYRAMPWNNLINLRQLTSHRFHQMDQELLLRAVDNDVIQIKIIANNLLVENEAAKLPPDDNIFKLLLEHCEETKKASKKNRRQKKQKTKKEPEEAVAEQKNRDIKYLNRILGELEHIERFLKQDPNLKKPIMLNATKLAIVLIGLSVEEHLSEDFKQKNPLNIDVEVITSKGKTIAQLTWEDLEQNRKDLIHGYYTITVGRFMTTVTDTLKIGESIKNFLSKMQDTSIDLNTLKDSTTNTSEINTESNKIIIRIPILPTNLAEIDVPSDGHCLFWSAALALLLPKLDQTEEFKSMYLRLFGTSEITLKHASVNVSQTVRIEADDTIESVKNLLRTYDCQKDTPNQFQGDILSILITDRFRNRVVDKLSEVIPEESRTSALADRPKNTTWDQYLEYMRGNAFGGEPEIHAISHLAQVNIETYSPNYTQPRHLPFADSTETMYLVHVNNNHYHFGLANALYEKHIKNISQTDLGTRSSTSEISTSNIPKSNVVSQRTDIMLSVVVQNESSNLENIDKKRQLISDKREETQENLVSQSYSQSSLVTKFSPFFKTSATMTEQQEEIDSPLDTSLKPEKN